jgi:hypothetical protein
MIIPGFLSFAVVEEVSLMRLTPKHAILTEPNSVQILNLHAFGIRSDLVNL